MPRYLKQNGKRVPNFKKELAWFIVPVKSDKGSRAFNTETYLLPTRVADYIELLENKFTGESPKLPLK